MSQRIIAVNVGVPRDVQWKGRAVRTGIFKQPIDERVAVRMLNIEGDQQADLSVHGGPEKAVYAYAAEHYEYWRQELGDAGLPWGAFGENLVTAGVSEDDIHVGDQFRIGTVLLQATQPRLPCYKLGVKFGREDMVKRFLHAGRYGVYFAVIEEGELGAGDRIERVRRDANDLKVIDIARLYLSDKHNLPLMRRAAEHQALPESWREYFRERLEALAE